MPGQIPTRVGHALDKAIGQRIIGMDHHNGDRACRRLRGANRLVLEGDQQIDLLAHKRLRRRLGSGLIGEVAPIEVEVFPFFIPQGCEALTEPIERGRHMVQPHMEEPDAPDFCRCLGVGRARGGERTEQEDTPDADDAALPRRCMVPHLHVLPSRKAKTVSIVWPNASAQPRLEAEAKRTL